MKKRLLGTLLALCMLITLLPVFMPEVKVEAKKAKGTLNYNTYELKEGTKFKLKLKGAEVASFKSSNKKIAKVTKKGNVTGVKIGEAVITVTDKAGKKYKCTVNVVYNAEHHVHTTAIKQGYAATCTEEGLSKGEYCETCGVVFTPQTPIPAKGHDYGKDGKCKVCGEMDPNYKPPHEHTLESISKEATCTESGFTEKVYCSTCGEVFMQPKEIKPLGHNYVNHECTRCHIAEVHEYVTVPGKAPTCVEPGYTDYVYCKICNDVLQMSETIQPLGHEYNGGITCVRCGADLNGHVHTWVIEKYVAPTCKEPGRTEGKYCSSCGYRLVAQEFIPRVPHNFKDGKCTVCGALEE
ncbi:MAG: Ig-like domain-containing protein [Lachnospiraceae bacterium]|nr:Ig-like domain-containing protein [Lachnospiraceae bacterium]